MAILTTRRAAAPPAFPFLLTAVVLIAVGATSAFAQSTAEDFRRMSLEQLLDIEVTTVSRRPEQAMDVPAAIFVLTQEDIRRSGAASIPEVLRLVPGLQVARINAGTWSIGVRGFADRLARSMLVMIDGRAVYSPLFAGTYWETQDVLLSDVDRIEVVRGPGGTLWGANAVNGIINIITKPAAETAGTRVVLSVGTEERARGAVRYGGSRGDMSYRVYAKAFDRSAEFHADGNDYDTWRAGQAGFRADWALQPTRTLILEGDVYDGRLGERPTVSFYTPPYSETKNVRAPLLGGNFVARLTGRSESGAEYQLKMYYDHTSRDELPVGESRDTGDVDFQQSLRRWPRQVLTWGAGFRVTSGRITAIAPSAFSPPTRTDRLYSAFVQDEVELVPARWKLTFGSKLEHNDYSGVEAQPSVRAVWTPAAEHSVWGAATRAVRTPSRVETDFVTASFLTPDPLPTFIRLGPNPAFRPEKLQAYELGYRLTLGGRLYATASGFYNRFDDLLTTELLDAFVEDEPPRLIRPVTFANGLSGYDRGVELTADYRPIGSWRVTGAYSSLKVTMTKDVGSRDLTQEQRYEGGSPRHQVQAGTSVDVGAWSADWQLRHVSALINPAVPAYTTSDLRLGWRQGTRLELALVGRDLLQRHHLEWASSAGNAEIRRAVFVQMTWSR